MRRDDGRRAWTGWLVVALAAGLGGCSDGAADPTLSPVAESPRPALDSPGEVVPSCEVDAECAGQAEGPCEVARCDEAEGVCVVEAAPAGTSCDDGDACTGADVCQDGLCVGGDPLTCEPEGPCEVASCDPAAGCVTAPVDDGAACDDGNPCTEGDACQDGACVGATTTCECVVDDDCEAFVEDHCAPALVCSEGECVPGDGPPVTCEAPADPCLEATCDPATGECIQEPVADGTSCGEGDGCAAGATCQGGACVLPEGVCDDGNPCTEDVCDPVKGCGHLPADGACDDGDPCTGEGQCVDGACVAEPMGCECSNPGDCTGPGFDPCLGTWSCEEGHCALQPDTGVDCSGVETGPCEAAACDSETGQCVVLPADDGAACDDGDPCTLQTTCSGGTCGGGVDNTCDDDNPCTNDKCSPTKGCQHTPNNVACDDGDACTEGDHCANGACEPGAPVECAAPGTCEVASCDPDAGCVVSQAPDGEPCDDGDACTDGDQCTDGVCEGTPTDCDDGDACTTDSCDPASGCAHEPITCSGDPGQCEVSACDPATGECVVEPAPGGTACDDGDACTEGDQCVDGACEGAPLDCDDGDVCTADACVDGACTHEDIEDCVDPCEGVVPGGICDDGDPATVADMCLGGQCAGFAKHVQTGIPDAPSVALRKVDHSFGRWFVAARIEGGLVPEPSAILGTWNEEGVMEPYLDTVVLQGEYLDLGFGFAAEAAGAVWVFRPDGGSGSWHSTTGLQSALEDSDSGIPNALWATGEPVPGTSPSLWVAGEDWDEDPWVRRCLLDVEADEVKASCHGETTEAVDDTVFRALTGEPCSGDGCGPVVLCGDNPDYSPIGPTQYYNDTFERQESGSWIYSFIDKGASPSRTRDVVSLGGGRYLAVGTAGYFRYRDADGDWSQNLIFAGGQSWWQMQAARVEGGAVVVVGWREQMGGSRSMTIWTMPADSDPGQAGSWTMYPLDGVSGAGNGLFDVSSDGAGTVRAVGSRTAEDGSASEGIVYTRTAPSPAP
ncbi:MAG: hypothetical protein ACQEXJ_19540 [Myxococcota bacterium]